MSYDTRPGGSASGTSVQGPSNGAGVMFWPDEFISDEPFLHPGPPGPANSGPALYFPDLPPASANANDDEFNTGALGGVWTAWVPGAVTTQTVGASGLEITNTNAVLSWGGIYRAIPAGDWTLETKVSLQGDMAGQASVGMFVAQDLAANPTTADFETLELQWEQAGQNIKARVVVWSAYNTFSSLPKTVNWYQPWAYVRIQRVGATYTWSISENGYDWLILRSAALDIASPAHVGLAIASESTPPWVGSFRFWRQVATTGANDVLLGQTTVPGGTAGAAGAAGTAGVSGTNGPAVYLEAEAADEPWIIPGPQGIPAAGIIGPPGPAVYLEADLIEPDFFPVPGPIGPASSVPGPAGPAIFLEADVIEPDFFVVPGKDGAKGADGAPGTGGGSGVAAQVIWPDEIATPDEALFVPAVAGSGFVLTDFTKDLSVGARSGTFDITGLVALNVGKNVTVVQTAAQIASKGNARDEPEWDQIQVTGYVFSATTIRCYWQAPSVVTGTYAFAYQVAA